MSAYEIFSVKIGDRVFTPEQLKDSVIPLVPPFEPICEQLGGDSRILWPDGRVYVYRMLAWREEGSGYTPPFQGRLTAEWAKFIAAPIGLETSAAQAAVAQMTMMEQLLSAIGPR